MKAEQKNKTWQCYQLDGQSTELDRLPYTAQNIDKNTLHCSLLHTDRLAGNAATDEKQLFVNKNPDLSTCWSIFHTSL